MSYGVELHDVRDTERFVTAIVDELLRSKGLRLSFHEREELEAEGLAIMCELARRYTPHHQARREDWNFSGYAQSMLPKRLIDVLRRNGTRTRDPKTGKRGWKPRTVESLDRLMEAPAFDEARVVPITRFQREPAPVPAQAAA